MSALDLLRAQGGVLLAGTTLFLLLGVLLNLLQRAPVQRGRTAEFAVLACLVSAALTLAPLPRPLAAPAGLMAGPSALASGPASSASASSASSASASSEPLSSVSASSVSSPLASTTTPKPELPAAPKPTATAPQLEAPSRPESRPARTRPILSAAVSDPLPVRAEPTPQGTPATVESAPPIPVDLVLVAIWASGAVVSLLWLLLGAVRLARVLHRSRRAPHPLVAILNDCGLPRPRGLRLRVTEADCRPFCFGLLRSTIVLPAALLERPDPQTLRHVLRHELAHANQRDARGRGLFALAQIPLWFHPLYWWLRAQHRMATELLADDIAAGVDTKRAYAQELVRLVEQQLERGARAVGATALFRTRSDFYQRMKMLLDRPRPLATRCSWRQRASRGLLGLLLLSGVAAAGGATSVSAQEAGGKDAEILLLRQENAELRDRLASMEKTLQRIEAQFVEALRAAEPDRPHGIPLLGDFFARREAPELLAIKPVVVAEGDTLARIMKQHELDPSKELATVLSLNPHLAQIVPDPDPDRLTMLRQARELRVGETVFLPLPPDQVSFADALGIGHGAGGEPGLTGPTEAEQELKERQRRYLEQVSRARGSASGEDVDLAGTMDVAFQIIDLQGELRLAESRLEHGRSLQEAALISSSEIAESELRVFALQRKLSLAQRVARAKMRAFEAQLTELRGRPEGALTGNERGRLAMLEEGIGLLQEVL